MLWRTRAAIFRAIAACRSCSELDALHCLARKLGLVRDTVLATALLARYGKRGLLTPAQRLFDETPRKDAVAFNAMLASLGSAGRVADARALFDRMPERTPASWNTLVACYCRAGDLGSARDVFEASGTSGVASWNAMIDGYCKAARMDVAREMFDRMGSSSSRDVVTWNTMMFGYLRVGNPAVAIAMYRRLMEELQREEKRRRLTPTTVTMAIIVTACTKVRDFVLGQEIHRRIRQDGTGTDAVLSNALVDMYFKCGSVDLALDVFRTMRCTPTLVCWNTLIAGLGMNGRGEDAVAAFYDMVDDRWRKSRREEEESRRPDAVTFVAVLSACSHSAGLVPTGRKLFAEMLPTYGVRPRTEHYGCMVDLLCRAGHLDEAARLARTVVPPDRAPGNTKVLGSLVRAGRAEEGGVRMSEWAAGRISEMDVRDGAAYGLSNVYASLQRWDRVEEHRREVTAALRRRHGSRRKQPGRACCDVADSSRAT